MSNGSSMLKMKRRKRKGMRKEVWRRMRCKEGAMVVLVGLVG